MTPPPAPSPAADPVSGEHFFLIPLSQLLLDMNDGQSFPTSDDFIGNEAAGKRALEGWRQGGLLPRWVGSLLLASLPTSPSSWEGRAG